MDASLTTADGLSLHLQHWPAPEPARGTVLVVHGLGEHIARYTHVAAQINLCGWHAFGYDQRGHGWSQGARGALPDGEALLRDLSQIVDRCRTQLPMPLVLLGHSLGGLVASRFVASGFDAGRPPWWRPVDGLVLSSPALGIPMSAPQKALLAVMGRLAPAFAVGNGLDPAWLSRDAAVVERYRSDALVHDRVTPRLVRFLVDGGRFVRQRAVVWKTPTLLMYAGQDRCVTPAASAEFASAASRDVVQARVFAPLFHEIFNEPERGEVFAELATWLNGHDARAAAAKAATAYRPPAGLGSGHREGASA